MTPSSGGSCRFKTLTTRAMFTYNIGDFTCDANSYQTSSGQQYNIIIIIIIIIIYFN
jgi:hypothetical protein